MRVVSMTVMAAALLAMSMCVEAKVDHVAQFAVFKKSFGRKYLSEDEEARRLGIFVRNMEKAEIYQAANPHAKFGMNEFSDLSEKEFKTRHNSEAHYRRAVRQRKSKVVKSEEKVNSAQSVDWRQHGAVTPVKNQGQCGSCWSFSTTGNIEGQWKLAGNALVSVSEQELVSCDTTCNGCNGGLMDDAFEWIVDARGGGITSEAQYPYVSGQGQVPACDMSGKSNVAYIKGHTDIAHSEGAMSSWMSTGGPLSIGVDATSWQSYQGGVLTNCVSNQVDHGVLAVGYDLTANPPYWIIKNSWAASWGENGYIRVEYGSNQCLITTAPSSSIADGSHPVPPPAPPGPNPNPPSPPSPPSPSTGSFTQYTCGSSLCLSDCASNVFPTGSCIATQSGGSAIATCGATTLTINAFTSTDCSGSSTAESIPLDSCLQDTSGSYLYDVCSGSSSGSSSSGASQVVVAKDAKVHLTRRH